MLHKGVHGSLAKVAQRRLKSYRTIGLEMHVRHIAFA